MANIKAGLLAAVGTLVLVIVETIFLPIIFARLNTAKDSVDSDPNDNETLDDAKTLYTIVILFTVLGGMIGSLWVAVKG